MAVRTFLGTWEVTKFQYENESDTKGLEGVRFTLDELGNVDWVVGAELSNVPLFACDTYEVCTTRTCVGIYLRLRFGAFAGHVIEFSCMQHRGLSDKMDQIVLFCNGWCQMHCNRIAEVKHNDAADIPFSLLPALEEGYFKDVTITSANKKQFETHSIILQLLGDSIDWCAPQSPLQCLPENVLGTILHFLYSECLPSSMDDTTAEQVIQAISTYECLNKLSDSCRNFLKNNALKKQVIELVNEMHASINRVIEHFVNFNSASSEDLGKGPNGWAEESPGHLCYIIKQALRDTAVVCAKMLLLCDLFCKRKSELTREERNEIILYANSRVPILVTQVLKFFQAIKRTFSGMTPAQRQEIAMFLVPEIESIFDTLTALVRDTNKAMVKVLELLAPHQIKQNSDASELLSRTLCNLLHSREILKCRTLQEIVSGTLEALMSKKEIFNEMTETQKIRTLTRNFDQLIEELTFFLIQLEELPSALDDKLELSEFKFCFKVGTSKVAGILETLVKHRKVLQALLMHVCELVQRDTFMQALQKLDLLEVPSSSTVVDEAKEERKRISTPKHQQQQQSYKFNLVNTLYVPPTAKHSNLAKRSLDLFKTGTGTDMVFEVLSPNNQEDETTQDGGSEESTCIKAHRVIVAARCDWFRRALQSGMRESIDRKIIIHDTSPFLFRVFLEYLYGGRIEESLGLSTEQWSDLLLLSDRYEVDSLKQVCEGILQASIDMESALYYLSMADQFNARILRNACIAFIAQNQELTESELFYELPIALQAEIFDSVWSHPPNNRKTYTDTPDEAIADNSKKLHSRICSVEDLPSQDTARLQQCILQMRDILGDTASHDILVQVVLAADYDLCRAINYFYARE